MDDDDDDDDGRRRMQYLLLGIDSKDHDYHDVVVVAMIRIIILIPKSVPPIGH
jgi:hypothetical protein